METLIIFQIQLTAIAINASPQRKERFLVLQSEQKEKLSMIQDVKTWWNSTVDMLMHAIYMRRFIEAFLDQESQNNNQKLKKLCLDQAEWKQVHYAISILRPFQAWTLVLGQTQGTTIHLAFLVYNELFNHLEDQLDKIKKKRNFQWALEFTKAIEQGIAVLKKWYQKMDEPTCIHYNLATILYPSTKLNLYCEESWEPLWVKKYEDDFRNYFNKYYQPSPNSPIQNDSKVSEKKFTIVTLTIDFRRKINIPILIRMNYVDI